MNRIQYTVDCIVALPQKTWTHPGTIGCKSSCRSRENVWSVLFFRTCSDGKSPAANVTHPDAQEVQGAEGRCCWCWCPCCAVSLQPRPVCSVTAKSGSCMRTSSCLLPPWTTRLNWKKSATMRTWPTKKPARNERESLVRLRPGVAQYDMALMWSLLIILLTLHSICWHINH